jgi:hypothetical protein
MDEENIDSTATSLVRASTHASWMPGSLAFRPRVEHTPRFRTHWGIRLSAAGAAKDAQVRCSILLIDFTHYLVVRGRQPHPDPNFE